MKRIGIYANEQPYAGGAYQYVRSIVKAASEASKESYWFCVYSIENNWEGICKEFNIPFKKLQGTLCQRSGLWIAHHIPNASLHKVAEGCFHPLWTVYRRDKLDLMFTPGPGMPGKIHTEKTLITIYDIMHRYIGHFPEVGGEDVYLRRDQGYKRNCLLADGVLVDSVLGKKQLIESYRNEIIDLEKKTYILPYIAPDYIHEPAIKIDTFSKYFFYPAQFWKHKNHSNLVLAAAKLREKDIFVNLVFTGKEKNNKVEIERLIREYGLESQIIIYDYISNNELIYLYKNARALVMPTYAGATNIPPLEALELECPMMVSNNFAMPEQVGDAALTFNPDSVEEIANCMEQLWNDDGLCQKLIEAGKVQRNLWGTEQFRNRLLEIIDLVVD